MIVSPLPPLPDASDQDVVALAREGSEAAYSELLRRYRRPVFKLILRMVHDEHLAEDLTQDTFVKVVEGLDSYDSKRKFSAWIFKIANNTALDHQRRKKLDTLALDGSPYATTPDTLAATALQVRAPTPTPTPTPMDGGALGSAIQQSIAQLRDEYRLCFLLRHVENRSYDDIADLMNLPLGTVKTYLRQARNEMKHTLGEAGFRTRFGRRPIA